MHKPINDLVRYYSVCVAPHLAALKTETNEEKAAQYKKAFITAVRSIIPIIDPEEDSPSRIDIPHLENLVITAQRADWSSADGLKVLIREYEALVNPQPAPK